MKIWIKIIYIVITILMLLIGFFMPNWVLTIQASQMEDQVERYEINSIELNLTKQLFEKLNTVSKGYYPMDISGSVATQMTEEEVYYTMLEINEEFGVPLLNKDIAWEISPGLEINEDGAFSFVIWKCSMSIGDSHVFMIIDDATGKMLSFNADFSGDDMTYAESIRISQEEINRFCEKLKNYYGLSEVYFSDEIMSDMSYDEEGVYDFATMSEDGLYDIDAYGGTLMLNITLKNEMGEEMNIIYYIDSKEVYAIN